MFDEQATERRANDFATALFGELGDVDVITQARVGETARLMAIVERLDLWIEGLGDSPPPQRQRYLLDVRLRASTKLEKWLAKLEELRAAHEDAPRVLEGEHADYVSAFQEIALRTSTATIAERLQALRMLVLLGSDGTAAGALAEDKRRSEGAMTRALHGRRHVRPKDGGWREEGPDESSRD